MSNVEPKLNPDRDPFASSVNTSERAQALKTMSTDEMILALDNTSCLQKTTIRTIAARLRVALKTNTPTKTAERICNAIRKAEGMLTDGR